MIGKEGASMCILQLARKLVQLWQGVTLHHWLHSKVIWNIFPHIYKCQGGMLLLVGAVYVELEDLVLILAKSLGLLHHGKKLFGQPAPGKLEVTGHNAKCLTFLGSVLAMYV